jgi:shikimate kinase
MPDAPKPPEKSIALVGLPGAGKTRVGRLLAERLGLAFADSDAEVEAATGLGVAEIFEQRGERLFRALERLAIAALVDGPVQVIATGGGAFVDPATRALLLERCTVVWLDGDPALLAARAGGRPLLAGGDPEAALARLAATRNPLYAEAHIRIAGDEAAVERVVEALR